MARGSSLAGLSPRVRGSPASATPRLGHVGSIPARAGEPACRGLVLSCPRVYPRACGGACTASSRSPPAWGLSPRVRGSRKKISPPPLDRRSIPARAGEPSRACDCRAPDRVYPRACGGAPGLKPTPRAIRGLSPRVRGSRLFLRRAVGRCGSIPARAGEPGRSGACPSPSGVYPRACGGARWSGWRRGALAGLSPRVRGSPRRGDEGCPTAGSIPARAGEPRSRPGCRRGRRVYPRACGGASFIDRVVHRHQGLSPRVRGSPARRPHRSTPSRSIPARAGEPAWHRCGMWAFWVYPRACGGAFRTWVQKRNAWGLSPRVRGSRPSALPERVATGSIPARAGEPASRARAATSRRVYPRACGGASLLLARQERDWGLSPRVRGSHRALVPSAIAAGSIPARAGEPR